MKKTAAELVRHALEQIGVSHTFGIPGVHNTEIYDQLNMSNRITPVLVTHEAGASFMADAVSRTSPGIGTCVIVPAAGVTHAASGIAEAYLDGIPMLVISGGIRNDSGTAYQLHDIDQHAILRPMTKATYRIERHEDVVPTIYEAYTLAMSGEPGPVFVEVPVNLQMFKGAVAQIPEFPGLGHNADSVTDADLDAAADQMIAGRHPGLFVGWGARGCEAEIARIADALGAPVCTTLQGLGVFPATHRLHVGMGFGPSSVPAAENAFKDCDAMLAVGLRFAEIPTGSFGKAPPRTLVHLDINPDAIGANYPVSQALEGDARRLLPALADRIEARLAERRDSTALAARIAADKAAYAAEWDRHKGENVNPNAFFKALRRALPADGYVVTDDGNHTFLTAELMPIETAGRFLSPTDFNCMGYCVPAVNAVKLVNPGAAVVGIVGDGAFMMTGMEAITGVAQGLGVVYFVFADGELSQISQAQDIPYNRKTCTVLGQLNVEGVALATGAGFHRIDHSADCGEIIGAALDEARRDNRPVIVDVRIDYSKRTRFTKGTVATNLKRFDTGTKLRFVGRALKRRVTG